MKKLEAAAAEADQRYSAAATKLSAARNKSAEKLNKAVNAELAPLKLERAKFMTQVETDAKSPGPQGIDRVEFWVQTNPGTKAGPLMKVASGGELSRFLLALKVVLSTVARRLRWCSTKSIPSSAARWRMRSAPAIAVARTQVQVMA